MSDPAAAAARRALVTNRGHGNSTACEIDSAREALKPIRELHKQAYRVDSPEGMCCTHDGHRWPCPTARLVYSTEELP